jgi:hypothetical protein
MKPTTENDTVRKKDNLEVRRKVLIASEGYVTEINYLNSLNDYKEDSEFDKLIDIVVLNRFVTQSGYSNPNKLIDLLKDYLHMLTSGIYSHSLLTSGVPDSFVEQYPNTNTNDLYNIQECLKERLATNNLIADGLIKDTDKSIAICKEYLISKYDVNPFELSNDKIDYDPEIDDVYPVVDRDKGSMNRREYDRFIKTCEKNNFVPIVTNPKFEFWLLLHEENCEKFIFDIRSSKDPVKLWTNV